MDFFEGGEFGNIVPSSLMLLFCLSIYLSSCLLLEIDKNNKKKEEYLKHYTINGERLTFGDGNLYEIREMKVYNYFKKPVQMCEEIWVMSAIKLPYDTIIAHTEQECINRAILQIKKLKKLKK